MGSPNSLRFGLVGFGAWGAHHARAIQETVDAELRAIAVPSDASRNRARSEFPEAFVTGNYHDLLARDDIDVVDVVVPNSLHCGIGLAALRAGKHLLLEKPMATTLEDCGTLLQAARDNRRQLAVGLELRLSSQWGAIKRIIERGEIGEPRYVLAELFRRPYRLGADGWRYDFKRVGNWILEEPIHFFDLARWYLAGAGEPREVFATANARTREHPELQDNFSALLRWPDGAYAVISQTLSAFEHHQTVKISGTEGALWAGWSGVVDRTDKPDFFIKVQRRGKDNAERLKLDAPSGELFELRAQIAAMVKAIASGEPPPATGRDGLWSTGLCLAAEQSIREHRTVNLEQFMAPHLKTQPQ